MRPRLRVADEHLGRPGGRDRRVPRDACERDQLVEGTAGGIVIAGEVEAAQGVAVEELAWEGKERRRRGVRKRERKNEK